jgi:hypothetical protein
MRDSERSANYGHRQIHPPLSPFFAALADRSQLAENPATLSLVFATLTRFVTSNPFVCHSYEKTPGVWATSSPRKINLPAPALSFLYPDHAAQNKKHESRKSPTSVPATHCSFRILPQFSCTFLHSAKTYLPSFQEDPASCCKTAGVGYAFRVASWPGRRLVRFHLQLSTPPLLFPCSLFTIHHSLPFFLSSLATPTRHFGISCDRAGT